MLDMDEPDEVIAAAGKFRAAVTSVTDHVDAVADDLNLPRGPQSPLDHGCAGVHRLIPAMLREATPAHAGYAITTNQNATETTTVLATADIDGGLQVHRAEPV
ncbi:hypothetical protein [Nocardia wallacei]|uniref:Uncharacterized protein n=1 Tax=Nocardia wallacei TaxID=480035 RepID=A0A7G1KSU8_9NOCA|nr:hypothetical protein [Nocardia wallacei]BCK57283.1 hypothetical protein NWFMUON74_50550 [Nocardia wallacei]